jgi:chromosome partitioning protein
VDVRFWCYEDGIGGFRGHPAAPRGDWENACVHDCGSEGWLRQSTVTTALGVRATHETGKVALIDLNEDQGTLCEWWVLRGRPANPFLYDGEGTLDEMVEDLRADGWTYAFLDGPPYEQDLIEMSVIVASAVLIPVKLAYFDAAAIDSVLGMCQRRKKPYAFLVNEFDSRKTFANANAIALAMLEGRGPILNTRISYSPKHRVGQIDGKTGAELDKGLAREIDSLWTEVKALAGIAPSMKAVKGSKDG